MLSGSSPLTVTSHGRLAPDGTLTLDQAIIVGDKAPRTRRWVMRADRPGRWTGRLSEAAGEVTLTRRGAGIAIAYRMANGAEVAQTLVPVDARRVENRMTVRRWGVPVAMIVETIVKD